MEASSKGLIGLFKSETVTRGARCATPSGFSIPSVTMGRSSRATALLAAAAGCGVLSGVDAFAPSVTGLALRGGRVNVASRGVCAARGVGMMAKSDRDDGATDEEIREAYDVYNNLMGTMNNGRGESPIPL